MIRVAGLGETAGEGEVSGFGDSAGVGEVPGVGLTVAVGEGLGEFVATELPSVQPANAKISPASVAGTTPPLMPISGRTFLRCKVYGRLG
jgi:hypothetical protein